VRLDLLGVVDTTVLNNLGTLDRLIQREILGLEGADELLVEMIACGYRSPVASLRPFRSRELGLSYSAPRRSGSGIASTKSSWTKPVG
jgi:hypothetical protein